MSKWTTAMLVLMVAVAAVFGGCCLHEFLSWDDWLYVAQNPTLRQPTLASLIAIWRSPEPGLYIPLPYTAWWLIAQIALVPDGAGQTALNPWLFHSANVALHLVAAATAFYFFKALRATPAAALLGAAVFGLHPLAVETVAWTMGLRDILAGLLSIVALRESVMGRRFVAAMCIALAVLSKPTSIVVLPMAIAIDALWLRLPTGDISRRQWPTAVVCGVGTAVAIVYSPLIHAHISELWQRPFIAMDTLAFYVVKWLLPVGLTFDYSRTPASIFASKEAFWTPVLPLAIAAAVLILRRRGLGLAALLFVIPLLPVMGLVPFAFQTISTVADHYAYLSLIGPAVGVAMMHTQRPGRKTAWIASIAVVALAVISFRQTLVWSNDETFFTHAVAVNPKSAPAWNGLAGVAQRNGDLPAAQSAAEHAVAANPDYAFAHLTLMNIALSRGDTSAVNRELNELERTYALQANFDPKLAAAVRAKIERSSSGAAK